MPTNKHKLNKWSDAEKFQAACIMHDTLTGQDFWMDSPTKHKAYEISLDHFTSAYVFPDGSYLLDCMQFGLGVFNNHLLN